MSHEWHEIGHFWKKTLEMNVPPLNLFPAVLAARMSQVGSQSEGNNKAEPEPTCNGHITWAKDEQGISLCYFKSLGFCNYLLVKQNLTYTWLDTSCLPVCFLESADSLIFQNSEHLQFFSPSFILHYFLRLQTLYLSVISISMDIGYLGLTTWIYFKWLGPLSPLSYLGLQFFLSNICYTFQVSIMEKAEIKEVCIFYLKFVLILLLLITLLSIKPKKAPLVSLNFGIFLRSQVSLGTLFSHLSLSNSLSEIVLFTHYLLIICHTCCGLMLLLKNKQKQKTGQKS